MFLIDALEIMNVLVLFPVQWVPCSHTYLNRSRCGSTSSNKQSKNYQIERANEQCFLVECFSTESNSCSVERLL